MIAQNTSSVKLPGKTNVFVQSFILGTTTSPNSHWICGLVIWTTNERRTILFFLLIQRQLTSGAVCEGEVKGHKHCCRKGGLMLTIDHVSKDLKKKKKNQSLLLHICVMPRDVPHYSHETLIVAK